MNAFRGAAFVTLFFAINVMGVVRYFFKWGEPATSPTYTATPAEYFWAWNLMTAGILLVLLTSFRKIHLRVTLGYVLIVWAAVLAIMQSEVFYVAGAAKSLILSGFVLVVLSANGEWLDVRLINKTIDLLGKFLVAFLLLQIVQYETRGILPSHSHEGFLIRYGSIYDDSLVLAMLMPMYIGYYLRKYSSISALLIVCVLGFMIVFLTGSFTGLAIVVVYLLWYMRTNKGLLFGTLTLLSAFLFIGRDYIAHVWAFKADSIRGHMGGWSSVHDFEISSLVGGFPHDVFVEVGYLSILMNFGLPVLLTFIGLMLYTLTICTQALKRGSISRQESMFYGAVEGLTIAVLIGNLNFPVIVYPPVFLVLSVLSGLAIYLHIHEPKTNDSLSLS